MNILEATKGGFHKTQKWDTLASTDDTLVLILAPFV